MKTIHRICRLLGLLFLFVPLLGGCGSSDEPAPGPNPPEPPGPNPPEPVTCTFAVHVTDLEAASAKVRIEPEKADFPYCFTVVTEEEYAKAEGEASTLVSALIARTMNDGSLTGPEAVARIRRTGIVEEIVDGLAAKSVYFAMAVGIDEEGKCTTDPAFERFATTEAPAPQGGFTVAVSDIDATHATLTVTPDNDEMYYYYDAVTAADYEGCGGDLSIIVGELIDYLLQYNPDKTAAEIVAAIRSQGPAGDTLGQLPPSTDFYAFAIGLADDGTCITKATVEPFRTLDPGDPKECTFAISFSQQGSTGLLVTVEPSDESVAYFTAVIPMSEYGGDANLTARVQQGIVEIAAENNMEVAAAVDILAWHGLSAEYQDGLEPSTDYYAFAYALAEDASAAGPLFKERFTTLGPNTSPATVEVSVGKYFDGTELEAAYPDRYAGYSGKVCVLVEAAPSDDAVHWYTAMGGGDMTDPNLFPEETTIDALLQGGTADKRSMRYIARWGDATLLGVAVDEYYQFGKVFRAFVTLKPEDAAPVEEFEPETASLPLSAGIFVRPTGVQAPARDAFRLSERTLCPHPSARRAERLLR